MTEVLPLRFRDKAWRVTNKTWLLFSNNLFKVRKPEAPTKDQKDVLKKKSTSKFYFNPRKPESKGTIVYTPEGYGVIQDPKTMAQPIPIKLNSSGKIKEFDPNLIFVDIPIIIGFMSSNFKGEEQLTIPINISPKEIVSKIEASIVGSSENVVNVQVFFQGRELSRQNNTSLERLGIIPNSKFIAVPEVGIPYTIVRYQNVYNGWGYSDKCINATAFSVNKSIKIRGFGMYMPDDNNGPRTCAVNVRFVRGIDDTGQILFNKQEVQVLKGDSPEINIFEFLFDRPIRLNPGDVYSCVQEAVGNYSCCTFYGDKGQGEITGEKDVNFTFVECYSSVNNTNKQCGQIPEIYYYA